MDLAIEEPEPELVREQLRICGRGRTELVIYSRCTGCRWTGPPWDGPDQPPLDDAAHRCVAGYARTSLARSDGVR